MKTKVLKFAAKFSLGLVIAAVSVVAAGSITDNLSDLYDRTQKYNLVVLSEAMPMPVLSVLLSDVRRRDGAVCGRLTNEEQTEVCIHAPLYTLEQVNVQ